MTKFVEIDGGMWPDFTEEVARGAELLDRVQPNWWTLVDVFRLDMSEGQHCIVGQAVTGMLLDCDDQGFGESIRHLFAPAEYQRRAGAVDVFVPARVAEFIDKQATWHGFDLPEDVVDWTSDWWTDENKGFDRCKTKFAWDALGAAWIDQIRLHIMADEKVLQDA